MTTPIYIYPHQTLAAEIVGQIVYPLEQLRLTRFISAKKSDVLLQFQVEMEANTKYIHLEHVEVFSIWSPKKQNKLLQLLKKSKELDILVFMTSTLPPPQQIESLAFILINQK